MKTCTKCGEEKPLGDFGPDKRNRSGLRGQCRTCDAAYYVENRERIAAYQAANRERLRGQQYAYHAAHPHVKWESRYRIRCRRYGLDPVVESFTREDLIARYGDACVHCGGPFEQLDHHPVPVALGGPHSLDNCVPSCAPCNTRESYAIRIALRDNRPNA